MHRSPFGPFIAGAMPCRQAARVSSLQLVEQMSGPSQQVWQRCVAAETVQQLTVVSPLIGPDVPARMSTGRTFATSSGRGESSPVTLPAPDWAREKRISFDDRK